MQDAFTKRIQLRAMTCIAATLLFLMLTTTLAHSVANSPLHLEISAGFHGYYRVGSWFPIRIDIENHGAPLNAHIAIQLETKRFIQRVSLPSPAKKRFAFDVLTANASEALSLSLTTARDPVLTAYARLKRLPERAFFILIVTYDRSAYDFLHNPVDALPERYMAYLSPLALPDGWKAYEPVDAVILDASGITSLRPLQQRALIRWLYLGGKLLFVDRTSGNHTSAFYQRLLALPGFGTAPSPAVTHVGLGSLLYTALPPDATPEASRIDWERWLPPQQPPVSLTMRSRQVLQRLPLASVDRPYPLLYLGSFFCLYVAAMGALASRLLSRCVNPWRGYAAVAGTILIFAMLPLLKGFAPHGVGTVVREATLIHVFPQTPDLYLTSVAAFVTPRKQRYHLQTMPAASIRTEDPMPLQYTYTDQQSPIDVYVSMPMWTKRRFFIERFAARPWFSARPNGAPQTLVNTSPSDLRHCYLLGHEGMFRLPDVPPGRPLPLTPLSPTPIQPFQIGNLPVLLKRVLSVYSTMSPGSPKRVVCWCDGIAPSLTSPSTKLSYETETVLIVHLEPQRRS